MRHLQPPALLAFLVVLGALIIPLARADDESPVTIIVSGDQTAAPVSQTIATTTVLTAQALLAQGAQTVADALKLVPGVILSEDGQLGSASTVSIRGFSSDQYVVLVDGQRVTSSAFEGTDLSKFMLADVSRIEVIRGPVSSVYGADAIGGVINIITRRPVAEGGDATLGVGSHGRVERSFTAHDVGSVVDTQVAFSAPEYSGTRPNSDWSGEDASATLTAPDLQGWRYSVRGEHYQDVVGEPSSTEYPTPDDRMWFNRDGVNLTADRSASFSSTHLRAYEQQQTLNDDEVSSFMTSHVVGTMDGGEASWTHRSLVHDSIVGAEARDERYQDTETPDGSSPTLVDRTQDASALYGQDRWAFKPGHELTLGVRYDDITNGGAHITPHIGLEREVSTSTCVRLSYADAVRPPSLVDLYYDNPSFQFIGNPDLKPERSQQVEAGVHVVKAGGAFDGALFAGYVHDQIAYAPYTGPLSGYTGTEANIERARQQGGELTWYRRLSDRSSLNLGYTYLNAVDEETEARLLKVPHNTATGALTWQPMRRVQSTLSGRWMDNRPDFGGATIVGRAIFDLTVIRTSDSGLGVPRPGIPIPFLTIRNLANTPYEETAGYPAEGFSVEAGVRLSWSR